jgi:hypothetical protein
MSKAASSIYADEETHKEAADCLETESPTVSRSAEASSNCEDEEVRKDDLVEEETSSFEGRGREDQQDYQDDDEEYEYVDYGDYGYGDGDHEYAEGEYEYYGEAEAAAAPPRRRGSLLGNLMVWAGGADHQDPYFESERNHGPQRCQENRRASMDTVRPAPSIERPRRRCLSSDEIVVVGGDQQEEEVSDTEATMPRGRAPRRNSLHEMVERALMYVNLKKPDPTHEDLCPFGTRRDSLF